MKRTTHHHLSPRRWGIRYEYAKAPDMPFKRFEISVGSKTWRWSWGT